MSTFYVVGTPIGNLEDITLRGLSILAKVEVILCEDTRVTRRLLDRHSIKTRTLSYHAHSKLSRTAEILELLKSGKDIALVSDAGTPGISDPGSSLIRQIRSVLADQLSLGSLRIESIPGPSALTAALSIAGVPCADFTFLGFLPHKKGRETIFKEIADSKRTTVFYESPHRIMKTFESLRTKLPNDKKVTVCRELTKVFEEVVAGSAAEIKNYFEINSDKIKGEFVVIVTGKI